MPVTHTPPRALACHRFTHVQSRGPMVPSDHRHHQMRTSTFVAHHGSSRGCPITNSEMKKAEDVGNSDCGSRRALSRSASALEDGALPSQSIHEQRRLRPLGGPVGDYHDRSEYEHRPRTAVALSRPADAERIGEFADGRWNTFDGVPVRECLAKSDVAGCEGPRYLTAPSRKAYSNRTTSPNTPLPRPPYPHAKLREAARSCALVTPGERQIVSKVQQSCARRIRSVSRLS